MNENSLMQKLVVAKKMMDIHTSTPRGSSRNITMPNVENFDIPNASYNIPQDMLMSEQAVAQKQTASSSVPQTKDKILNSKLPDEIKRLMIEHPISQPAGMSGPSISDELVNKASRLMKENLFAEENNSTQKQPQKQTQVQNVPGNTDLKKLVKEAVREILSESGLMTESTSKSNDQFSFRVGQHIFEGKISKIKKLK
jgi:hypothetical protein